jgi:hypothetical protein
MAITVLSRTTSGTTVVTNTTCGLTNGAIVIDEVTEGTAPYTFNFNNFGFGTNTTFTNLSEGSYPLAVEDANGCIFNTVVFISNSSSAPCEETSGWVANIFSPNGNGVNEVLKIYIGPDIKRVNKFEIFDRWGSKLFIQVNIESNDNQDG